MAEALVFSIPFGGYKSWHEPSSPLPDWAEVISLAYLRSYFLGVVEHWPGGVVAEFTFVGEVTEWMSNVPVSEQHLYLESFRELLRHFSDELVRFEVVDVATRYVDSTAMNAELESNFDAVRQGWDAPGRADEIAKRLASARRNFRPDGTEDVTALSPSELESWIVRSAQRCEAVDRLTLRRKHNKFEHRIQLVFVRGPVPSIHIGSSRTTANHFWVGSGVLEVGKSGDIRDAICPAGSLDRRYPGRRRFTVDPALSTDATWPRLGPCFAIAPP